MLTRFRRLMEFELSIAELIGIGLLLAAPYLIVGVVWSSTHTESFQRMGGVELLVSVVGSIVLWPALLLANVCLS
jgi:NADH:ubiquinone oxidoreductase subunit 4 (subunit M)